MEKESFKSEVSFDLERVQTKVIIETFFSKEIRILLAKNQLMKEHKAPFPILIHILEGIINLGVNGEIVKMQAGDIISLDAHVLHDLKAVENSIIRLTLSKYDKIERVNKVID